jgi:hypothetical protein
MRRREFITLLGGAATASWPLQARAQQSTMPLMGLLRTTPSAPFAHIVTAFRRGLNELGFVEGQNIAIEQRWTEGHDDRLRSAEDAAKSLHLNLLPLKVENPPYDIAAAFRRVVESDSQMVLVLSSPLFGPHHKEIAEQTIRHRLPAMFMFKSFVVEGGLISYGPDVPASFRRVADYVAKILNGTKPADLPVEQPTRFELVVNLKTAKAIGIDLPTSLLLRADEVIE